MDGSATHTQRWRRYVAACRWWRIPTHRIVVDGRVVLVRYPRTNGKHVYWPVPKCASTSMSAATNQAGWERVTDRIPEGHHFVIVRNPVDRWFSGMREYITNNRLNEDDVFDRAREGRMVWDQHTVPQVDYLPDRERELILLEDAAQRVSRFGLTLPHMRQAWTTVYPDLIPAVKEYYADDMEMYDSLVHRPARVG